MGESGLLPFGAAGASTGVRADRFEALSADDQHHALASRALELEHRVQDAGEQLAAVAAKLAVGGSFEVDLFQGAVHVAGAPRVVAFATAGC
jgi:hypothetical protein